ncbi:MAG: serine hydrolase domain-containing protein [Pseudomonadales bacterium]|jgi:CubicO group peptidase (beta-lactamase class C family)|tara:strand:+ start:4511 stop:5779 length:1269 start_codon:yes stop_codon:yes gene_type:complete
MLGSVIPESVGLSSDRLARITEWLEEQVSSERLAGCSVLIGRNGAIPYFHAVGMSDIENNKSFERDTIVRIYSMSKAVTTVAAMMLYEQGSFQLDDPVSKYLPEFADTPVWLGGDLSHTEPQSEPMLVRHIMTHTSGLTYGFMHTNVVDEAYRDGAIEFGLKEGLLEDQVKQLAKIPLICQPGSQWNYSVSSDVLGRLVEVWSGQSLATFFETEIFKPLGMKASAFHVASRNHEHFSALYAPASGGDMSSVSKSASAQEQASRGGLTLQEPYNKSRYCEPVAMYSGGGGLTSTIDDYGRFCQMLSNKGELDGVRLLGRKTVEHMRKNHLPDNKDMAAMGQPVWSETSYDGIGFGLGFAVVIDPVKASIVTSEGEYHWGGAASTFFWIDPEEDLWVVFFTQLIPSSTYPIRRELRTRVYQALV